MKYILSMAFALLFVCGQAQIVDYRPYQSAVKNQKGRGTCTAFSICAALESFPGFPSDLSEQYIYALAKSEFYKEMPDYGQGGFLKYYIDIMQKRGTLSEESEPYNPNAPIWDEDETTFKKMQKDVGGSLLSTLRIHGCHYKLEPNMYTYRSGDEARDVEWVKARLDEGVRAIPVSYLVNGNYWFNHTGSPGNKIKPQDFIRVVENGKEYDYSEMLVRDPNLPKKLREGELEFYYPDTNYSIGSGHAVTIVGYDESGFLIKNSWGVDEWGNQGYGWVSFDYHRLLAEEVMALHLGKLHVMSVGNGQEPVKKENLYLKTLPRDYYNPFTKQQEKSIHVSFVYHGNRCMPPMKEVELKGYDAAGKHVGTWYGSCQGIFSGRETGYGAYILNSASSSYPTLHKLVVNFTVNTGEKFINEYYGLTCKNQEYRPK